MNEMSEEATKIQMALIRRGFSKSSELRGLHHYINKRTRVGAVVRDNGWWLTTKGQTGTGVQSLRETLGV
jgi:hypothetical protein